MPAPSPALCHAHRPGDRIEARRRTPAGIAWARAVVVAREPFGCLARFPDGAELPRPLSDVRPTAPFVPQAPPRPAVGARVLFSPYDDTPGTILRRRFDERAKLIADHGDTVTLIVAGNSVRQDEAFTANADGVRRLTVPARLILPDVAVIGRAVLVDSRRGNHRADFVRGVIVEDNGNTVTVQEDGRTDWNGRHICSLDRVRTPQGRPLPEALYDEACGREVWEVDFRPELADNARRTLERAAARFEEWGDAREEVEQVRAMIAFPSLDLVLSPTEDLERLRRHLDEMERPTIDLSVKGLTARVTVTRRGGTWGYQFAFSHRCGSGLSCGGPRDSFMGAFASQAEAMRAGIDALCRHAAPPDREFTVKAQQAAANRFLKRVAVVRATIT
jgi:hypothetical protein